MRENFAIAERMKQIICVYKSLNVYNIPEIACTPIYAGAFC